MSWVITYAKNSKNFEIMSFLKYGLIFLFFVFLNSCNGERTKDRMYIPIKATTPCFRRLNATHQTGCSSVRGGSKGVVHYCTKEEDLQFILKNGTAGPYVPVIPVGLLTKKLVTVLEESTKISGLVLYLNNDTLNSFTHDLQCPNENFGVPNTCTKEENGGMWNQFGTGLLFEDITFPIFYMDDFNELHAVKECFEKFNNFSYETQRDRSLCSVQMNSFMYGAKNTPTCIRRSNIATNLNPMRVCDPLGDKNIWATLFPIAKYNNTTGEVKPILGQKYIIIAARSDTASMFDRTSGAESPITGFVTLLTTSKILKNMLPKNDGDYNTNILFVIFDGETFDYIGSQRMLYDMERGNFPVETENGTSTFLPVIRANDILLFLEFSQLSRTNEIVFAHRYKVDEMNDNFTRLLISNSPISITVEPSDGTLPPSSAQTFLREYSNISTIILANHQKQYSNKFYNSIFDNSSNINYKYNNKSSVLPSDSIQKHLYSLAYTVSKSVYQLITNKTWSDDDNAEAEYVDLVDELLHCYLEDQNCKIHQAVGKQPQKFHDNHTMSLYVGIDGSPSDATTLIGFILGWFTGDIVGESTQNCTNLSKNYAFRFYNMSVSTDKLNTTKCFSMVMNFTEAVSPAFIIEDYDWSSNKYSSWTESTWGEISMRLFLKPSAAQESMTMAIGCIAMIFSFFLVYLIKSRSHVLFTPEHVEPIPVDC
ncbi:nicastrin [Coccinella septempunctata]|uniref:nicastrin n=1 Tax=Coccinella septempunctata TaxID=41139 RepID=UPI001D08AE74|nr:nicastrin [Coccinella septempunctata]